VEKVEFYLKVAAAIAIPVMAFTIRMIEGDTKNDNEVVISQAARTAWSATKKKIQGEARF
jgi:hypothetical protein